MSKYVVEIPGSENPGPVLSRGHAGGALEGAAEDAFRGIPHGITDGLYGQPGVFQQVFRGSHAHIEEVFMRREACFAFEDPDEMVETHTGAGGQILHPDILGEMLRNIGGDLLRDQRVIRVPGGMGGPEETRS